MRILCNTHIIFNKLPFTIRYFQSTHSSRNQRMGRVPGSTAKGGQRFNGQPGLSEFLRKSTQSHGVHSDVRHSARRWRDLQGLCTIHDVTRAQRPQNRVLQQRLSK